MTGDPWDGRTLEWATSSPPPDYNFAFTPVVHDNDTWADMKKNGYKRPLKDFVRDPHAQEHLGRLRYRGPVVRGWLRASSGTCGCWSACRSSR